MSNEVTMFSIVAALPQAEPASFALGDFWNLTQQAGPLRWPIFLILGVGLAQVFTKLWELLRDRRVSAGLAAADLAPMKLDEIVAIVAEQEASMLAELQSTMLNVFQTRPAEGMLHDEISNFVAFQQDQFGEFRRRMEFLSDTAGAFGLMGTVWGMFTVFFQGTAEQDVILRGMGIALITTLLGLVVSIILNFSAMEIATFFGKRLERVSRKSDELRFRLMELAPAAPTIAPIPMTAVLAAVPQEPIPVPAAPTPELPEPVVESEPPAPPIPWRYIEMKNGQGALRAGELVDDLAVIVKNADGEPATDVPVLIAVVGDDGALEGDGRTLRRSSDDEGRVEFSCALPESVGPFVLDVSLPEQPGPPQRLEMTVRPAIPERVDVVGNHQAAVAGMKLPSPLGVRVSDRFGNLVPGVTVEFSVRQGGGRLGSGTSESRAETDAQGVATTPFVVSSEVGQNVVSATVDGTDTSVEFVAFGTEV